MVYPTLILYSLDLTPLKEEGGYFTYYSLGKSQLEENRYPWALIKAATYSLTPEVLADLTSYYLKIKNHVAARACAQLLVDRFKSYATTDPYFKGTVAKAFLLSGNPEEALRFSYDTQVFEEIRKKVVVYRTIKKLLSKPKGIHIEPEEENPFYSFFENPDYPGAISVLLSAGMKEEDLQKNKPPMKLIYALLLLIGALVLLMTGIRKGSFGKIKKYRSDRLIHGTIKKLEEHTQMFRRKHTPSTKGGNLKKLDKKNHTGSRKKKQNERIKLLLTKALKFLEEGDREKALAYLKAAEKLDPNHPEVLIFRSRIQ